MYKEVGHDLIVGSTLYYSTSEGNQIEMKSGEDQNEASRRSLKMVSPH